MFPLAPAAKRDRTFLVYSDGEFTSSPTHSIICSERKKPGERMCGTVRHKFYLSMSKKESRQLRQCLSLFSLSRLAFQDADALVRRLCSPPKRVSLSRGLTSLAYANAKADFSHITMFHACLNLKAALKHNEAAHQQITKPSMHADSLAHFLTFGVLIVTRKSNQILCVV